MSYILDALKKSDQERQQNNGPSLQTVHRPHLSNKNSTSRLFLLIVSVTTIFLFVLGFWYVKPHIFAGIFEGNASKNPVILEPEVVVPELPVKSTTQVTSPDQLVNDSVVSSAVVEFWELPDPVQASIPALTFSFHVFSTNPDKRTIIINKHRVKQGDSVSAGLILEEITTEGVVLNWQQRHRFSINVVESW
jgi:general secretion pathway protein B